MGKELLEFSSVQDWLSGLSAKTRRNYLSDLPDFLDWLNEQPGYETATPDDLIEIRKQDWILTDPKEKRRFEKLLMAYYESIKDKYAPWTSSAKVKTVQSFFKRNYMPLTFLHKQFRLKSGNLVQKYVPQRSEVRLMDQKAESWRNKALLRIMYQSGISPTDVSNLDVERLPSLENPPCYIEVVRQKTSRTQMTCLHPDTVNAIKQMFDLRGYPKEGPLFTSTRKSRLTPWMITQVIRELARRADIADGGAKFHPKNLRDAYKDGIRDLDSDVQSWLMGHRGGMGAKYGAHQIREYYLQIMDNLSITEQTREKSDLEKRVATLEAKIEYHEETIRMVTEELRELRKL